MCGRSSAAARARRSPKPPAPFHAIAGFAGPSLLAMMLVEKYANHQPLNRQSEQYAREGIELSISTMADHVGACAATLKPLYELIKAHVFAAERVHGDDTTVPVLAKVKTRTGRIWTYVRDDRPFGGAAAPACVFFYSPDRASIHPEQHLSGYCGTLKADAYAGFTRLYAPDRQPGPITKAGRWAHARPQAVPACRHRFQGASSEALAQERVDLFTRLLANGRICLGNNAAEPELRVVALGRRSWLFAGSDRGGSAPQ